MEMAIELRTEKIKVCQPKLIISIYFATCVFYGEFFCWSQIVTPTWVLMAPDMRGFASSDI